MTLGALSDMQTIIQALHTEVLDRLHVLLAIALELPEDYFTSIHKYEVKSEVSYHLLAVALFALMRTCPGSPSLYEVQQVHTGAE